MQRLILVRHGQTDHNVEHRLQGQIDIPMNARGHEQARLVSQSLAGLDDVAAIYTSPLSRARVTAEAISSQLGTEIAADPRLLERGFGEWEGLTRPEIKDRWPDEYEQWVTGASVTAAGVESREDVGTRMNDACRDFHKKHDEGTVIVVSHGAAISLAITALLGLELATFRGFGGMANCGRAELSPRSTGTETGWMSLTSLNVPPSFSATP